MSERRTPKGMPGPQTAELDITGMEDKAPVVFTPFEEEMLNVSHAANLIAVAQVYATLGQASHAEVWLEKVLMPKPEPAA